MKKRSIKYLAAIFAAILLLICACSPLVSCGGDGGNGGKGETASSLVYGKKYYDSDLIGDSADNYRYFIFKEDGTATEVQHTSIGTSYAADYTMQLKVVKIDDDTIVLHYVSIELGDGDKYGKSSYVETTYLIATGKDAIYITETARPFFNEDYIKSDMGTFGKK